MNLLHSNHNLSDIFLFLVAGTVGNVIANRLTEDVSTTVLILEAGISYDFQCNDFHTIFKTMLSIRYEGQIDSEVPFTGVRSLLVPSPINWNFTTVAEPGLNNRTQDYPRGFVLGGSSSINGMIYTRGSSDDYNRYAALTGNQGWSWDGLQPYIRKNEIWTEPTDHHKITEQFNSTVHGFNGISSVSLLGFSFGCSGRIINATQQLPDDFPFNLGMSSRKSLGIAMKYLNRPNLYVLINARVTKIFKTSTGEQQLAFQQVEFTQDGPTGKRIQVQAEKEIILSAGAVNTPFLLLHSGVGDTQEPTRVGVQPLLHLPSVGKNASDHSLIGISWSVNSTNTLDEIFRNTTLFKEEFVIWNKTHSGLFGTNMLGHIGRQRIPKNSTISKYFHRWLICLSSNDLFQQPLTKALTSAFDALTTREGIKLAKKFVSAPEFKDYIISLETTAFADNATDAKVEYYNTEFCDIVNPDLTVKCVKRLRIVDASILPFVPSAHTQATL
ncbi:GMC oxidoreductase [Sphaerobolus stellatus SS14]|uniref:GMC oxidoreductase n=1 Tax=Sphaerobolus stellatus (strain SS14) TaxID=990650 RepID=A0A0C9UX63_SPHS4|nr:GMC oxidoreductase [Sphaerobolus stellatus SS14]